MNTTATFSILYRVFSGRSVSIFSLTRDRYANTDIRKCIREIKTVPDCIDAIRLVTDGDGTADQVWKRLVRCFRYSLPTDVELQTLSILQQAVEGTRGIEDYSVTTIWLCALQSIIETELKKGTVMKRCSSVGCIHSRVPLGFAKRSHSF